MIDIQLLRDNPDLVKQKSLEKQKNIDTDALLEMDKANRELLQQVESLRQQKNEISAQMKSGKLDPELIEQGKQLKVELADREELLKKSELEFNELFRKIPNFALDDVPKGETEDDNVVEREEGQKPEFGFTPKTHWEIGESRDLFDKERAVKIAGSRFVYLKGGLVKLQFAIMQYVMDTLTDEDVLKTLIQQNNLSISTKEFVPVLPPAMLRTEPYVASARLDAAEVTYKLEGDDLWLNASAEHTMCTMYWNEVLPYDQLPIRYIAYSPSFRREAGTYGKDTEGIIRLHQFDKLEMEVFSSAETGLEEHKLLIALQEHFVQALGLHYRFIRKSTADIGKPNATGIDIDCWFPGQERYIETHTADYMTDYQARDLKIRSSQRDFIPAPEYTNGEIPPDPSSYGSKLQLVHTNDATAFALGRILAAIMENYQNEDMTIRVPEILQKYMGGKQII
jgi:seryl-tRNA synthetase